MDRNTLLIIAATVVIVLLVVWSLPATPPAETTATEGVTELRALGRKQCAAIMCAEAVWWRCHRRIIADYLINAGESVFHILGPGRVDQALLTPGAVVQPNGTIIYPPAGR